MSRIGVLAILFLSAAILACNNVVTIYDYSSSGKTHTDTVYVERPPAVPDTTEHALPPGTGAPVPPDSTGSEGAGIEHPGRWSTWQDLVPGTAKVQTICAPIDSLTIYRMLGNVINGRGGTGGLALELNLETRRSYDGAEEYSLILVFQSHTSWQDRQASGTLLSIDTGRNEPLSFDLSDVEDQVVEPQSTMLYVVRLWLPVTLEEVREIATQERVTAIFTGEGESQTYVFSEDNLINFMTFFEVFMIGEGTKSDGDDSTTAGRVAGTSRS
jgi:hypothetical protein